MPFGVSNWLDSQSWDTTGLSLSPFCLSLRLFVSAFQSQSLPLLFIGLPVCPSLSVSHSLSLSLSSLSVSSSQSVVYLCTSLSLLVLSICLSLSASVCLSLLLSSLSVSAPHSQYLSLPLSFFFPPLYPSWLTGHLRYFFIFSIIKMIFLHFLSS